MDNVIYIFIEKEHVGPDQWMTVDSRGNRAPISAPLLPQMNWTSISCLLVRSWSNGADLKEAITNLAGRLDTSLYDYRLFLHPGTGSLSGQDPRKIWQQPRYDSISSMLRADRWPRLWSVEGSQSQSFSKVVKELVNDIVTNHQLTSTISNWSARWSKLNEAWDQATDFFSIHPKLRKAVCGLCPLSGQIEYGTPTGWAPLTEVSVQKVAQGALDAANEILKGLHGEQDGKATAVKDQLEKIVTNPLEAIVWEKFLKAVNDLKS